MPHIRLPDTHFKFKCSVFAFGCGFNTALIQPEQKGDVHAHRLKEIFCFVLWQSITHSFRTMTPPAAFTWLYLGVLAKAQLQERHTNALNTHEAVLNTESRHDHETTSQISHCMPAFKNKMPFWCRLMWSYRSPRRTWTNHLLHINSSYSTK